MDRCPWDSFFGFGRQKAGGPAPGSASFVGFPALQNAFKTPEAQVKVVLKAETWGGERRGMEGVGSGVGLRAGVSFRFEVLEATIFCS